MKALWIFLVGLLGFCQQSLGQSKSELFSHEPSARESAARPNIVLILADDLGLIKLIDHIQTIGAGFTPGIPGET
mgnify:CR=1 FL=1